MDRARHDAADLEILRTKLSFCNEEKSPDAAVRVKEIAHGLAGSGGIFGFAKISLAAAKLEDTAAALIKGTGNMENVEQALQTLIQRIDTMNAE